MDIETARINMLKQQLRTNGVLNEAVLAAFARLPREEFVPPTFRHLAYGDISLPLAHEQVMLTPQMEAQIVQYTAIKATDKVLEIGTGTGYLTAVMATLAHHVTSVDIFADFTHLAASNLKRLALKNVSLHTDNAAAGWGKDVFDVIIVSGALPFLPESLLAQLAPGGRLFAVLGQAPAMQACVVVRDSEQGFSTRRLFETKLPFLLDAKHKETFRF